MRPRVAVLRTAPASVLDDYGKLMRLAGYRESLPDGRTTYLKANIAWPQWYPGASTAPWQLEGVLRTLLEDGYAPESLMVKAACAGGMTPPAAEVNNGLAAAAGSQGLKFNADSSPPAWAPFEPRGDMAAIGGMGERSGIPVPEHLIGSNILHLPTMKTQSGAGIAGSGASAFDCLMNKERRRLDIHAAIADALALQKELASGVFTVMDGTFCGDGPGPVNLKPFVKNYIIAGADPVAVDAVAAHMMGFDPMDIRYIRLATEWGVGVGGLDGIEVAGEDVSRIDFRFSGPGGGRLNGFDRYIEYLWYPWRGWPRVGRMAETGWGQLLQQKYLPQGARLEGQGKGKGPLLALAAASAITGLSAWRRLTHRRRGA